MSVLENWPLGALISLFIAYRLAIFVKHRQTLTQLGCSPVSKYPHWDPFLGYDLHRLLERSRQQNNYIPTLQQLYAGIGKCRTFQALTWGRKTVYTTNPENIRAILAVEFGSFGVEAIRKPFNVPWIRGGILVSDGPLWRTSRAAVKPHFSKPDHWDLPEFGKHIDRLLANVPGDGTTVDLQPLFFRFYLDIATEFLLGESADSQVSNPRIDVSGFFASKERVYKGLQRRVALSPFLSILPRDRQWERACDEVSSVFDRYIGPAMAERRAGPALPNHELQKEEAPMKRLSVLRELVDLSEDPLYIRDQLISLFLPLHDGTPIGIIDLFSQMSTAPTVFAKLRAEVLELGDVALTFEVLKSMKYVQCIIKESLRLRVGGDRIVRICLQDCVLPRGGGEAGEDPIFVQRGTIVQTHTSVLHRDPTFWGPDSYTFRPERWLDGSIRPPWQYIPFGGGSRVCPGQQMALTQYAFILARFARAFETLECKDEARQPADDYNLPGKSKNGVKVALRKVMD